MRSIPTRFAGILLASLLLFPAAPYAQKQSEHVTRSSQQKQTPKSFTDYAFGKINPDGKNYGDALRKKRSAFAGSTIDDLYFWSNVVTLVLLTGITTFLFFNLRAGDKKERIAAALIAQLWNGRVSDRIEVERRTLQYNQLVEVHNAEVERRLMAPPTEPEAEEDNTENLVQNLEKLRETQPCSKPSDRSQLDASGPNSIAETTKAVDVSNLQQQNLLLRQQVEAIRNTEQNLKARLNQTIALLEKERMRNQTLKGA